MEPAGSRDPDPFLQCERFYRYTMGPCVISTSILRPVHRRDILSGYPGEGLSGVKGEHAQPCQTCLSTPGDLPESGGAHEFLSSPRAKNISILFSKICGASPVFRLDARGALRLIVTKRRAGCGGRDAVVCPEIAGRGHTRERYAAYSTSGGVAEGEVVSFWRPDAGAKLVCVLRIAR